MFEMWIGTMHVTRIPGRAVQYAWGASHLDRSGRYRTHSPHGRMMVS